MIIEIVTSYFAPYKGGVETVVLKLAEGLGKKGHKVYVHTAKDTPGPKNLNEYKKYKYFTVRRYPIYDYSLLFPKFFHKNSILSLHNYSCLMNDYVAFRFPNRKKILSAYGNITYERKQRIHTTLAPIYDRFIGRRTLFNVNKIVAMTNFEKKQIIDKYPMFKNKVDIVAAGIDFAYKNTKQKKPFNFPYFVSLGRIVPTKHFDDILKILKYFPKYHYILAGRDNGYANTLVEMAKQLGVEKRFHYVGEINEKQKVAILTHGEIFIMPDAANAFGIANLEAFYYLGKVVATDSGGMTELTKEFGGEIFHVGDLVGLQKAIKKDLSRRITLSQKKKLRNAIEKKYSWEAVVDAYERVLLSL